jgi:hypothetical protein
MAEPSSMVTQPFISTDIGNNLGGVWLDNGSFTTNGTGVISASKIVTTGQVVSTGSIVAAAGISVTASGVTITAGGVSVTAGGATITAGGESIVGGLTTDTVSGGVSAITCTIGSTIAVTGVRVILGIPSNAAAATNLTLATGLSGQEITIINSNSTGSNTLVFTGNVVANVTISGATAAKLVFNSTLASWTKC